VRRARFKNIYIYIYILRAGERHTDRQIESLLRPNIRWIHGRLSGGFSLVAIFGTFILRPSNHVLLVSDLFSFLL
jgi:hypothetical protein